MIKRTLSFDGKGINGPDEYRTRIATFTSEEYAQQYGRLFEAAPEMADEIDRLKAEKAELLEALKLMTLQMEDIAAHEGAARDEIIERMHLGYTSHFRTARAAIARAEKGGAQ